MNRRVALKVLPLHSALHPQALARFKRESTLVAELDHPGIVAVFEVGEFSGQHFFAMELLDGAPLDRIIAELQKEGDQTRSFSLALAANARKEKADPAKTGGLDPWAESPVKLKLKLAIQLCDALSHAHARGIMHRDIKPANIIIQADGRAVLTDFGLARRQDTPGLTQAGHFLGTPYYVSPEQAEGSELIGPQADIFSLAATLFELFLLRLPFPGESTTAVIDRIRQAEPDLKPSGEGDVSVDLAAVIFKALAKNPENRYASMVSFGADLRRCRENKPVTARHATPAERLAKWIRREPLRAMIVAILLIAIPVLASLGGYIQAKSEAITTGEEKIARDQLEGALAQAYGDLSSGQLHRAYSRLEKIIRTHGPVNEALAGQLLVLGRMLDDRPLQAWRQKWRDELAKNDLLRNIAHNFDDLATIVATVDKRSGWSPSDYYIAGFFYHLLGGRQGDRELAGQAVHLLEIASMRKPCLHYTCELTRAAMAARDQASLTRCIEILEAEYTDRLPGLLALSMALKKTNPDRALQVAHQAAAKESAGPDALTHLAQLQGDRGDREGAAATLKRVLQLDPHNLGAQIAMARSKLRGGDKEAGKTILFRALAGLEANTTLALSTNPGPGRGRQKGAGHRRALVMDRGQVDWIYDLALGLIQAGEMEKAIDLLNRRRGMMAGKGAPAAFVAEALVHAGRLEEAHDLLEPLLKKGLVHPMSWLIQAKIYCQMGADRKALDAVKRVRKIRPDYPDAIYVEALLHYNLKEFSLAEEMLISATKSHPTSRIFHELLMDVLKVQAKHTGKVKEADRYASALFSDNRAKEAALVLRALLPLRPPGFPAWKEWTPRIDQALNRYEKAAKTQKGKH